jgi:hypothetical protein
MALRASHHGACASPPCKRIEPWNVARLATCGAKGAGSARSRPVATIDSASCSAAERFASLFGSRGDGCGSSLLRECPLCQTRIKAVPPQQQRELAGAGAG